MEKVVEPLALKRTEVLVIADDLLSLFQERIQPTFQEAGKATALADSLEFTRRQLVKLTEEHAIQAQELGTFHERASAAERETQMLREEIERLRTEIEDLRSDVGRLQADLEFERARPLTMGEMFWGRRAHALRKGG